MENSSRDVWSVTRLENALRELDLRPLWEWFLIVLKHGKSGMLLMKGQIVENRGHGHYEKTVWKIGMS